MTSDDKDKNKQLVSRPVTKNKPIKRFKNSNLLSTLWSFMSQQWSSTSRQMGGAIKNLRGDILRSIFSVSTLQKASHGTPPTTLALLPSSQPNMAKQAIVNTLTRNEDLRLNQKDVEQIRDIASQKTAFINDTKDIITETLAHIALWSGQSEEEKAKLAATALKLFYKNDPENTKKACNDKKLLTYEAESVERTIAGAITKIAQEDQDMAATILSNCPESINNRTNTLNVIFAPIEAKFIEHYGDMEWSDDEKGRFAILLKDVKGKIPNNVISNSRDADKNSSEVDATEMVDRSVILYNMLTYGDYNTKEGIDKLKIMLKAYPEDTKSAIIKNDTHIPLAH